MHRSRPTPAAPCRPVPRSLPHALRPGIVAAVLALLLLAGVAPGALARRARPADASVPAVTGLQAVHRSGQTFLTWTETAALTGERYRIYRGRGPIADPETDGTLLAVVGEGSSRLWSERARENGRWTVRTLARAVVPGRRSMLRENEGVLVWTLDRSDLRGRRGKGWYAVVTEDALGARSAPRVIGPVKERVGKPRPVRARTLAGGRVRVLVSWMDLRRWNPTFDAPGPSNEHLGLAPGAPGVADALAYAYVSVVALPPTDGCRQSRGGRLAVGIRLHGRGGADMPVPLVPASRCWIELRLTDPRNTAWFGFGERTDYRTADRPDPTDRIAGFTEARVLRALHDLVRDPELGRRMDKDRVYVYGGSMGGTGTLALSLRYPHLFAAAYAWVPVTDWSAEPLGADRSGPLAAWGPIAQNLPVHLVGTRRDLRFIRADEGEGVWTHQDLLLQSEEHRERDSVPLGIASGRFDDIATFVSQGARLYPALERSDRAYGGAVLDRGHVPMDWAGLPPSLGIPRVAPFGSLHVVRDETVPGIAEPSSLRDWPPGGPRTIHDEIAWSASWSPFAGPPVDRTRRWSMALRSIDGEVHALRVTPRRLQRFRVRPGAVYRWTVSSIDGRRLAAGRVTADADRLLTVPVRVTPAGVRVTITPHITRAGG